ncbi:MAG TPA: PilZ domain-containing protein [Burkholderiales bacterium]|nr:PilZ domain-containing protein [Burkholderiales bacterium]
MIVRRLERPDEIRVGALRVGVGLAHRRILPGAGRASVAAHAPRAGPCGISSAIPPKSGSRCPSAVDQRGAKPPRLVNVGMGGLAFRSDSPFRPAHVVKVRIACVRPAFETTARVAWCRSCTGGYELGLAFLDPDEAFRARMVEQVCHILRGVPRDPLQRRLLGGELAPFRFARLPAVLLGPETRQ